MISTKNPQDVIPSKCSCFTMGFKIKLFVRKSIPKGKGTA